MCTNTRLLFVDVLLPQLEGIVETPKKRKESKKKKRS